MDYSNVYENNIIILSKIENGILSDQEEIKQIFGFIKMQIIYLENNILKSISLYLHSYFDLSLKGIINTFYQKPEFNNYKKSLINNIKNLFFLEKKLVFLKKEKNKKEKNKNYQNLIFLYTILYYIIYSKEIKTLKSNDKTAKLQAFIKGYSLTTYKNIPDDSTYDENIKECILKYKRERKKYK